jgi:Protein of unknown function (DUF2591)
MKHQVAQLEGAALDYMVWCIEHQCAPVSSIAEWAAGNEYGYAPSEWWPHGGPIIALGRIAVIPVMRGQQEVVWVAEADIGGDGHWIGVCDKGFEGPTVLIAAMRAWVASKFGAEVEIP